MLDRASDPRLEQDLVNSDILRAFPRVSKEDISGVNVESTVHV